MRQHITLEKPRHCMDCNGEIVEIVYGLPSMELVDQANSGKVILGGCCISGVSPEWGCLKCKAEYISAPETLLTLCRNYGKRGGNENLAQYEEKWIEWTLLDSEHLESYIAEYKRVGLAEFSCGDNVPIGIKAILYNRCMHWGGGYETVEGFKEWYTEQYLQDK